MSREIAPISVQAPTVATPRLPGTRPISASTQAISRSAMPRGAHQLAGEDEERDREQRVILEPAEHDLVQGDRRQRHDEHHRHRNRRQEHEEDRRSERRAATAGGYRAMRSWLHLSVRSVADQRQKVADKHDGSGDGEPGKADQQRRVRNGHRQAEPHARDAKLRDAADEKP